MDAFWDAAGPYVEVLLPTIVVALIFWYVMKAIFNADRREREAEKKVEQEADARVEARAEELRREAQAASATSPAAPKYGEYKDFPDSEKN